MAGADVMIARHNHDALPLPAEKSVDKRVKKFECLCVLVSEYSFETSRPRGSALDDITAHDDNVSGGYRWILRCIALAVILKRGQQRVVANRVSRIAMQIRDLEDGDPPWYHDAPSAPATSRQPRCALWSSLIPSSP
jgi:hypothetical protein